MNRKEISELRRRLSPDKNAIGHIYGCYVNTKKEIIAYPQAGPTPPGVHRRRLPY